MKTSGTYCELVDRCRRKGLIVGLAVKVDKLAPGEKDRPVRPPSWLLTVSRGPFEKPLVEGARGPIDAVLAHMARSVAQQLSKAGWA